MVCMFRIQIRGFYVPKLRLAYEARRSEGLQINFDGLGVFNVPRNCRNLDTRALSFFVPIAVCMLNSCFIAFGVSQTSAVFTSRLANVTMKRARLHLHADSLVKC